MVFGDLQIRLEPWDVDYGSEVPLEGSPAERPDVQVDTTVETRDWQPIRPSEGSALAPRLVFVDGVRRIEARVVARRGDLVSHGAFGSYAVGFTEVVEGAARIGEPIVDRVLALASGESLPKVVEVDDVLRYRAVSSNASDADAPLRRLQEEMRLAEERLARSLADRSDTLVVADGPLTFAGPSRGAVVGYVKRIFERYVDGSQLAMLFGMPAGARSPLFALAGTKRFSRYSWFLRLAAPYLGDAELSGLVRLEVSDSVGLEQARRLADGTAGALPRFAPSRGRDPRAPQNLLPIGALEARLRRHLGDPRLIRRRLAALIVREAVHA